MSDEPSRKKRRVFYYVDGFNLYHRQLALKPSRKWLCIRKLAECQFPHEEIAKIKFFTALVDPHQTTSPKQIRQRTYWEALKSQNIEVIEGLMERRSRKCKAHHVCDKLGEYSEFTEKMSDVNLALHIYRDFIQEKPEIICVLSADLDVLPALKMIRETGTRVMLVVQLPTQDKDLLYSRKPLFSQVARTIQLSETFILNSRLPEQIESEGKVVATCPPGWAA